MHRRSLCLIAFLVILWTSIPFSEGHLPLSGPGPDKMFLYTAKKWGVPILKASIHILGNGLPGDGRNVYQVRAEVTTLHFGFFFRMNNRFTSTFDAETCAPVRYEKQIDQDGLLREKKNYFQTLVFDPQHRKVLVEKKGEQGRKEVALPLATYDPLSMFARYYLKEELHANQEIRMSVYDGTKVRQLVFQSKLEHLVTKLFGEIETVRIESTTSFASFDDREGAIRIWYTSDGRKIPILMELDLPAGNIRFELEEVREG